MISEKMQPLLQNNSAIRMMFEEGRKMAAVYGADQVYDFSLGNPSVPAPAEVNQAMREILEEEDSLFVHGYMSNAGYEDVREAVAQSLNRRFDTSFSQSNILMTVGAASGLNVILKTLLNPGEQVMVFAPYFVEYGSYVRNYDGELVVVSPNTETFQPNLREFEEKICEKTKAVIINTPNKSNRSGLFQRNSAGVSRNFREKISPDRTSHCADLRRAVQGAGLRRGTGSFCDKVL